MGETVVLAQRLQVACQEFDVDLLMSEQMALELAGSREVTEIGETTPAGWQEPIAVFTLRQTQGEIDHA